MNTSTDTSATQKQLFNCKFASKSFTRESKKCDKKVKQNKKKCKKAIEKSNMEGSRIYAENAIREHSKSQQYLKVAHKLETVVAKIQRLIHSNQFHGSIKKMLNHLNKAAKTLDVDYVSSVLDRYFEVNCEDLDVSSAMMNNTQAINVSSLMRQIADGASLDTIGLAAGGSRDISNFRECIEQNIMPRIGSITYNGLLYEYYFDTTTRKYLDKEEQKDAQQNDILLFYPTYCFARSNDEYYMSLGLNSNIKQDSFKRKHLNLVIVLDQSGSMRSTFYDASHKTKMQVANESVCGLLKHLTTKDRFGLIAFESKSHIIQQLNFMAEIDLVTLKKNILSIKERGATNFEAGYKEAIHLFDALFADTEYLLNCEYENRIIFLTDAQPNIASTDPDALLSLVSKYANPVIESVDDIKRRIYTTFIGIGLDFEAALIETISCTRGCNYYSVQSADAFIRRMDEEFDYMVTPLVFDVSLRLNAEGNACDIDKIYGPSAGNEDNVILKIDTLFPSKKIGAETKGGIQLIKLKKNDRNKSDCVNVEIEVRFEDRKNKQYVSKQRVTFETKTSELKNDMIEDEENDNEFYDNLGIRKAILLVKYVELMMKWMEEMSHNLNQGAIRVDDGYKQIFGDFIKLFEIEMKICKDSELQKEIDVLTKLMNPKTVLTNGACNDLEARLETLLITN